MSGWRSMSARAAASPLASVKSPCSTASAASPAVDIAWRQPTIRSSEAVMSAGPAMVPIRVQPRAIEGLGRLALARDVVDVDVGHPVAAGPGTAAEDAGQADVGEVLGEPVVAVVGDDQGAVDVAVGEVAQRARRRRAGTGEQQHQLDVALAQHPGHAAQRAGEERVGEDAVVGLGDDHGDRVRTPRDQAARRRVGDVAQRAHRRVDGRLGARADPLAAVDRTGRRGARDARDPGHLVEGGLTRAHGAARGGHSRHASGPRLVGAGRVPVRASSAYQWALDFGVRRCVA